jgi:uncharacterized protein YbcI
MAVERTSPSRVVGSPVELPPSRLHRVTDALVGFYAAHYGRGPTKAKSFLMEDTLVCVMQEAFVDLERVFMRHGNKELVRQMRVDFHGAMRRELEQLVEEASGYRVEASAVEVSFDPEAVTATFTVAR